MLVVHEKFSSGAVFDADLDDIILFARTYLCSCLLLQKAQEALSLARGRCSAGGGLCLVFFSPINTAPSGGITTWKMLECCLWIVGGRRRMQAVMSSGPRHLSLPVFRQTRKRKRVPFSQEGECGDVVKSGLHDGRPKEETGLPG